ncbi:Uncharacterised protein [Mycobacteroides abscessus subsp. abscessus]|nr:Uncharacterised protein [Mycobacteroides abscessus subsp. abscessus]
MAAPPSPVYWAADAVSGICCSADHSVSVRPLATSTTEATQSRSVPCLGPPTDVRSALTWWYDVIRARPSGVSRNSWTSEPSPAGVIFLMMWPRVSAMTSTPAP